MHLFKLPDPNKKKQRALHETRLALIDAQNALEHYAATVAVLKQREARLAAELGEQK